MRSVDKSYDGRPVLAGLDLDIERGEVFAILGPNGAGKTTAVEILEGYRRADGGSVEVLGCDPGTAGAGWRARIGIVLQQTTSFENSSVLETVEMFASVFPDPIDAGHIVELVGLEDRRDDVTRALSGGQRRRLDVACGLVGRPELLFLDEPSTGLDPEARRAMWRIIARLRDQGTTVLLTTHYLDEAEALADRIGVLLGGRLVEVAEPARLGRRDSATATVRFSPPDTRSVEFARWQRDGDSVWIETDSPESLVAELVARHRRLDGLTVTRPTLEDVYLAMVARWDMAGASEQADRPISAGPKPGTTKEMNR